MKFVATGFHLLALAALASAFSPSKVVPSTKSQSSKNQCPFSSLKKAFGMTGIVENAQETLLDRLGGEPALRAAVDLFYAKLLEEESLLPYFEGVAIDKLKEHQFNFMAIAFTDIPDDMDVLGMIRTKHDRLYQMGLDEEDFDVVAGDFVATLQELKVPQSEIDDAAAVVLPLRAAFEKDYKP